MKIFITGSSSFVGRELIRQCRSSNIEYLGVDKVSSDLPNCHIADICSKEIFDLIPINCDAIVHLAALSRDGDCKNNAYNCFNINVMGTLNLIDAAIKRNVKQFIFASTEWVYGKFDKDEIKNEQSHIDISTISSEYALSKLVSESNLRQKYQHGFCHTTILRFGIIYGPRKDNWSAVESLLSAVKNKPFVQVGSLATSRCFIHVGDIASGIIKSVGLNGFNIINLEGELPATTLGQIIGEGKIIFKTDPKIEETNASNPNVRMVSNQKAKDVIGWETKISLPAGIESIVEFI
ncbi:MAG TPA: hypothetical protein DET40_17490 [Lentisphaeria bacterium]|nr:MAG: hypothetical protein A2X45_02515 [Lentisphaerae bacterium GWF2_50_93]HCE45336.1 hypothetical protein [Lentisphaeria bacterium]